MKQLTKGQVGALLKEINDQAIGRILRGSELPIDSLDALGIQQIVSDAAKALNRRIADGDAAADAKATRGVEQLA